MRFKSFAQEPLVYGVFSVAHGSTKCLSIMRVVIFVVCRLSLTDNQDKRFRAD